MVPLSKMPYQRPDMEVFQVKLEGMVCVSKLRYNPNSGQNGTDIEEEDIINGGSF